MDYSVTAYISALIIKYLPRFCLKRLVEFHIQILKCNAIFFIFFYDYSVSNLPSARYILGFLTLDNVGKELSL
jgi:hypothetical protein